MRISRGHGSDWSERGKNCVVFPDFLWESLNLPCYRILPRLPAKILPVYPNESTDFSADSGPIPSLHRTRKHVSKEALRERERIHQETEGNDYNLIRKAAEVHRQVRQYAKRTIKPGMSMIQIADLIEDTLRALVEANGLEAGIAFPTGLSLNEVAAHYHPNSTDKRSK